MNKLQVIHSKNIESILELLKKEDFALTKEECQAQYDVKQHDVFDKSLRKDKIIDKDIEGTDEDGNPLTTKTSVPVNRIGMPIPNFIVEQRIGFMVSKPVQYNMFASDAIGEKLIEATKDIMRRTRMEFSNKDVLRKQMSEMECARIWYFAPETIDNGNKFTLKNKVISPSLGYELFPIFNDYGSMIAFAYKYEITRGGEKVKVLDIKTDAFDYTYVETKEGWVLDTLLDDNGNPLPNPVPNLSGKIMVGYYSQEAPEWYNSWSMIERLETSHSNHADMNDYFGSPILAVSGIVEGFASKGEQGKILQLSQEARANYLQLTTPPESILKEQAQLRELALALANTADISFDKVKGIGNLSAMALSLLFISSTMAAQTKEEVFAVVLQRELNVIMNAIVKVINTKLLKGLSSVTTEPKLDIYTPFDVIEFLTMLTSAREKGLISIEQSVMLNPLVIDKEKEIAILRKDLEEKEV